MIGLAACVRCKASFNKHSQRHVYCASCGPIAENERSRQRMQEWRDANPVAMKEYRKGWLSKNKDKVRAAVYRRNRRLGIFSLDAAFNCTNCGESVPKRAGPAHRFCEGCSSVLQTEANRKRAGAWAKNNAVRRNTYLRKRFASSVFVRLNSRMSTGIGASLKDGKNYKSWREFVPYDLEALRVHLERQFLPGMTWDNIGEWHIDHILPLSSFSFETAQDDGFKAAWSLPNLRPLWATDNVRKNRRRLHLI